MYTNSGARTQRTERESQHGGDKAALRRTQLSIPLNSLSLSLYIYICLCYHLEYIRAIKNNNNKNKKKKEDV